MLQRAVRAPCQAGDYQRSGCLCGLISGIALAHLAALALRGTLERTRGTPGCMAAGLRAAGGWAASACFAGALQTDPSSQQRAAACLPLLQAPANNCGWDGVGDGGKPSPVWPPTDPLQCMQQEEGAERVESKLCPVGARRGQCRPSSLAQPWLPGAGSRLVLDASGLSALPWSWYHRSS